MALSGSVKSNGVCDLIPSATRTIALAVPFPNGTVTLSCETVVGWFVCFCLYTGSRLACRVKCGFAVVVRVFMFTCVLCFDSAQCLPKQCGVYLGNGSALVWKARLPPVGESQACLVTQTPLFSGQNKAVLSRCKPVDTAGWGLNLPFPHLVQSNPHLAGC